MATKNYEIIIKLNKKEMPKFKKQFNEVIMKEAGPEMASTIRDIFLYHKMQPGQVKDWPSFLVAHAGIFSTAIMNNIQRKYINYGINSRTGIRVESIPKGTELVITTELNKQADQELGDYNPDTILKMVSKLDPSTTKAIFQRAVDKAGFD